ncbi:MAG: tat pathway signal sequence domain protein [Saprospiraceae bacterium]|nr:tat pathway signal sequence domain protein [Saprospiraceae bacterium]
MKKFLFIPTIIGLFFLMSSQAQAQNIFTNKNNIAVNGYDVVSYFSGKPIAGKADITVTHEGAIFQFASVENKEKFVANTKKYTPQYGGWCAFGWAGGYPAKTEPEAWSIVDGKLYLNYDKKVKSTWDKDQQGYIKKADTNWANRKPR